MGISSQHGVRLLLRKRRTVGAVLGVCILVGLLVAAVPLTVGGDIGNIDDTVRAAIQTDTTLMQLPAGLKPGHLTDTDTQGLKGRIRSEFAKSFSGNAFTSRVNNFYIWVTRIAKNPTEPRLISYSLSRLVIDPPVIEGDSATVTGTYDMAEKQGYDLPDGRTATYGGTYTNSFTLSMQRRGERWFVVDSSFEPVDFVNDPAMASNLDVNPAPGATKPPVATAPIPVNP